MRDRHTAAVITKTDGKLYAIRVTKVGDRTEDVPVDVTPAARKAIVDAAKKPALPDPAPKPVKPAKA